MLILLINLYQRGCAYVREGTQKCKEFLHNKQLKIERVNKRKKKRANHSHSGIHTYVENHKYDDNYIKPIYNTTQLTAPVLFNFGANYDASVKFFDDVMKSTRNIIKGHRNSIYFDLSEVTEISYDAIIYLIAICYNLKNVKVFTCSMFGNYPKNQICRKFMEDVGVHEFLKAVDKAQYKYVKSKKILILDGIKAQPDISKKISDTFTHYYGLQRRQLTTLVRIFLEMMANTENHAYSNSPMYNHWYTIISFETEIVKITFLDTGVGIPATIRKKFLESYPVFGETHDSELMLSAFLEDNRSRTKLSNRGLGLHAITKFAELKYIKGFEAISGKGRLTINSTTQNCKDMSKAFIGTLYNWHVNIEQLREAAR